MLLSIEYLMTIDIRQRCQLLRVLRDCDGHTYGTFIGTYETDITSHLRLAQKRGELESIVLRSRTRLVSSLLRADLTRAIVYAWDSTKVRLNIECCLPSCVETALSVSLVRAPADRVVGPQVPPLFSQIKRHEF